MTRTFCYKVQKFSESVSLELNILIQVSFLNMVKMFDFYYYGKIFANAQFVIYLNLVYDKNR
jgi:hypothetical protein